jgi:hypothetical protein
MVLLQDTGGGVTGACPSPAFRDQGCHLLARRSTRLDGSNLPVALRLLSDVLFPSRLRRSVKLIGGRAVESPSPQKSVDRPSVSAEILRAA